MMGRSQTVLRFRLGRGDVDSWEAVETALALDPGLAEAHALKATHLRYEDRSTRRRRKPRSPGLDPDPDANQIAAQVYFGRGRIADAVPYWEKVVALAETDFSCAAMLMMCLNALGDSEGARRAARMTVSPGPRRPWLRTAAMVQPWAMERER